MAWLLHLAGLSEGYWEYVLQFSSLETFSSDAVPQSGEAVAITVLITVPYARALVSG